MQYNIARAECDVAYVNDPREQELMEALRIHMEQYRHVCDAIRINLSNDLIPVFRFAGRIN